MLANKYYYLILLSSVMICFGCEATVKSSQDTTYSSTQPSIDANSENQHFNVEQKMQEKDISVKKSDITKKTLLNCNEQSQFKYENVSFRCDSLIAQRIEVTEFSELPLQYEEDKPDYVHPSYLSFKFISPTKDKEDESDYIMEISVYPLEDYQKMYSISQSEMKAVINYTNSIKKMLVEKSFHISEQIPILTTGGENQAVRSHLEYPSFNNGQGMSFIMQISSEPELISNRKLVWVFQGITNDGKNYVYATFPVSAPFLPNSSATNDYEGYSIPTDFWNNKKQQQYRKRYEQYLSTINERLNKLNQNQYQPSLTNLTEILSSLEVE